MAIEFRPLQIRNPNKPDEPGLYYPVKNKGVKRDLKNVSREISNRSGVNTVDVVAVLGAFTEVIPYFLGDGDNVSLGDFGSFKVMLKGVGSVNEKDVDHTKVIGMKIIFHPGKEFKENIKKIN